MTNTNTVIDSLRSQILQHTQKYYQDLDETEFSHNFDHVLRVEKLAKRIARQEGADMEIIQAACLLFDLARGIEDRGEVDDHAIAGAEIARKILSQISFPASKIEPVCHAIRVHRKSQGLEPKTIEAKILQDADYLDALGAVDIARVIASSLQSQQYRQPIYVNPSTTSESNNLQNKSAIHYLMHKINHPRLQPKNFHTKLGRQLAQSRFEFIKQFVNRFMSEWNGDI